MEEWWSENNFQSQLTPTTTGLDIKLISAFFYPLGILLVLLLRTFTTKSRIPTRISNRFSSGALLYSLFSLGGNMKETTVM